MGLLAGVLALIALVGVGGVYAFGHRGPGGHGGGFGGLKMLMQLDLTDAQKSQIREVLPAFRAEKDRRQADHDAMRERMKALMEAERFDEDEVRLAFREMAPLMEDMAVSRLRFMHAVKAVLTPAQIAAVKERFMDRDSRRGEHRRMRESMMDTWLSMPAGSDAAQ
ncbi:MAG: Spy/CpxP family protein refolding chaperone [Desulfobacterales bacterium]|jgi:protein CpxP